MNFKYNGLVIVGGFSLFLYPPVENNLLIKTAQNMFVNSAPLLNGGKELKSLKFRLEEEFDNKVG